MLLRLYCIWENRKRDTAAAAVGDLAETGAPVPSPPLNLMDKTDRELPQFRYVY